LKCLKLGTEAGVFFWIVGPSRRFAGKTAALRPPLSDNLRYLQMICDMERSPAPEVWILGKKDDSILWM
jgi:hypothetical protein